MKKIEQPISNLEQPRLARSRAFKWVLNVGGWMWIVSSPLLLRAQLPIQIPPAFQAQLQVQQAAVDVTPAENISATASFDPAIVRAGEKTFYRVNLDAAETMFTLPEKISAPAELKFGPSVRGQIARLEGNKFRPLTTFLFEVQAGTAGQFTVSNFTVNVAGKTVEIPAASVEVVAQTVATPARRRLLLEASGTNLFLGEPFRLRVISFAEDGNQIEALREVQFNGGGLMTDKISTRQLVEIVNRDGQSRPAFIFETVATPIAAGPLKVSAQAFTAGREFGGPISISGQVTIAGGAAKYIFLTSETMTVNVRPLPPGELPGFTGTMGKYFADKPLLATNRLHVGEPVQLKTGFHALTNFTRFVPPELPRSRDWQIIADKPPGSGFTLIPQTDEARMTPVIPFSGFDPVEKKYYDLTIPAQPVTVVGEGLPVQLSDYNADGKNPSVLKLSALATTPGKSVRSLKPLQLQGWFIGLQLLPVLGLIGLWRWDEQRRFLAAHPAIVRRRKAKRDLQRERKLLRKAAVAGDAKSFLQHSVAAMRVAAAPHFPAEARALVGGDVLAQLSAAERAGREGETVRKISAAADLQFVGGQKAPPDMLASLADVEALLQKLEGKL